MERKNRSEMGGFFLPKYQMTMHGFFELSNTKIVSRANTAILTLDQAKAQLRVPFDDDDDLISDLIDAAQDYIEKVIEMPITEAAMSLNFDIAPETERGNRIYIPVRNATSVSQVSFDAVVADADTYTLNTLQSVPFVQLESRLEADQVTVMFTAGFPTVPADIRAAAKLLVSHWYKHGEAVSDVQFYKVAYAVDSLLSGYKLDGIA